MSLRALGLLVVVGACSPDRPSGLTDFERAEGGCRFSRDASERTFEIKCTRPVVKLVFDGKSEGRQVQNDRIAAGVGGDGTKVQGRYGKGPLRLSVILKTGLIKTFEIISAKEAAAEEARAEKAEKGSG